MKLIQYLIFAFLIIIVFSGLGTGRTGVQNRNGAMFFIAINCVYAGIFGVLAICINKIIISISCQVSLERPLYLRETMNKQYSATPYFLGKSCADIPFQLVSMTITAILVYFPLELNLEKTEKFFIFYLVMNLTYFVSASYGYCISILIANYELAISILPITVLPQTLLSGFMANHNQIPNFLAPFEYISIPKYSYQAFTQNEFYDLPSEKLIDHKLCSAYEDDICQPLQDADFKEGIWISLLILFGLGIILRIIALFGLKILAKPKRVIIQ